MKVTKRVIIIAKAWLGYTQALENKDGSHMDGINRNGVGLCYGHGLEIKRKQISGRVFQLLESSTQSAKVPIEKTNFNSMEPHLTYQPVANVVDQWIKIKDNVPACK